MVIIKRIRWNNGSNPYKAIEKIAIRKYGDALESLIIQIWYKYECEKDYRMVTLLLADDREDWCAPPQFVWETDWWEGEQDVYLVAMAPVSEIDLPEKWSIKETD